MRAARSGHRRFVAAVLLFVVIPACTLYPSSAAAVAKRVERDPYTSTLRTDWIQAQPGYTSEQERFRLERHEGPNGQREIVIAYRHRGLRQLGLWRVRIVSGPELVAGQPVARELDSFGRTLDGPRRWIEEVVSARVPEDWVARMLQEETRVRFEAGDNAREAVVRPYVMQGFLQACDELAGGTSG